MDSVFMDVREWHDKTYGNTYYSAIVWIDGKWVFTTGMKYGYEDHAIHECTKELEERGLVPKLSEYGHPRQKFEQIGIVLYTARREVKKRDLPKKDDPATVEAVN